MNKWERFAGSGHDIRHQRKTQGDPGHTTKFRAIVLVIFCQTFVGSAQGWLYSFSGQVSTLYYDGGGILAARNVAVGDPVFADYIVDFGTQGYYRLNDGSAEVATPPQSGNVHLEYFYCRLLSASLWPEVNGGFNNQPHDVSEYFVGWNESGPMGNEGLLWGGSGDSYFTVRKSSQLSDSWVPQWQVGTQVRGIIVAWSDQDWSIAWADMTLNSITPVPEPTTISVIMLACAAFVAGRKASIRSQLPHC